MSEDEFKLHVDLDAMATETAHAQSTHDSKPSIGVLDASGTVKAKSGDTLVDQATVQQLLDITHQQRTQIDD